jgi:hypothetical protein
MEPENLSLTGYFLLAMGVVLMVIGAFLFGEVYSCIINSANCPLTATDAANRIGISIPLLLFGTILITPGSIFIAAGHITEHLRPAETSVHDSEKEPEEKSEPLRVCVKCGRQVSLSASYCPNCGNQLSKP